MIDSSQLIRRTSRKAKKNFSLQASSFSRLGMQIWKSQNSILFSGLGKQGFGSLDN